MGTLSTAMDLIASRTRNMASWSFLFAVACFMLSSPAAAVILQISATSFVPRTGNDTPDSLQGSAFFGTLTAAGGFYYAPVVFPTAGKICRVSLVYRDSARDADISARLKRKPFAVGDSVFNQPVTVAQLVSSGFVDGIRIAHFRSTQGIGVTVSNNFYFVEVEIPDTTLHVLGVQIDFRPSCS